MSASIVERLKQWTTCDVCLSSKTPNSSLRLMQSQVADGLSKLKHPHGGFLDGLTMYSPVFQSGPTKIVGEAFTVKFVPKSDTESPKVQGNYVSPAP